MIGLFHPQLRSKILLQLIIHTALSSCPLSPLVQIAAAFDDQKNRGTFPLIVDLLFSQYCPTDHPQQQQQHHHHQLQKQFKIVEVKREGGDKRLSAVDFCQVLRILLFLFPKHKGLEDGMKKRAGLLFNIFRKFCLASLHPHSPSSFVSLAQLSSDLLQKLIPKMADEVEEAHLASRATVLVFSVIAICASSAPSPPPLPHPHSQPHKDTVLELTKSFLVALCGHTTAAFASMTARILNLTLSEVSDGVLRVAPLLAAVSACSLNPFPVKEYFDELVVTLEPEKKEKKKKEKGKERLGRGAGRRGEEDIFYFGRKHLTDLVLRCVRSSPTKQSGHLSLFTGLLINTLTPIFPAPTWEAYAEALPRIPRQQHDAFIIKLFDQNEVLYDFLMIISTNGASLCRCFNIIKALVAYLIGHWNSASPITKESRYFATTLVVISVLRNAKFIPAPLSYCSDIFAEVSSVEVAEILMDVWNFLREFPPDPKEFQVDDEGNCVRYYRTSPNMQQYTASLRKTLVNNVVDLAHHFSVFFNPPDVKVLGGGGGGGEDFSSFARTWEEEEFGVMGRGGGGAGAGAGEDDGGGGGGLLDAPPTSQQVVDKYFG